MFSQVWMKLLERRPASYDRWMDRLSSGQVARVKAAICAEVWGAGAGRVLEIGCGTGELAATLASRCERVEAFDENPEMLELARRRSESEALHGRLRVWQMGVEGMDGLPGAAQDAVVATLVLSELSGDERRYTLSHAARVLRPGGLLVLADEVVPRSAGRRLVQRLARAPQAAATYLVSRAGSRPLRDPAAQVRQAGLSPQREERSQGDRFSLLVARRPLPGEGAP
jgi:demethylmenaquinone methyltransferase/2-methoxy-6-polyprenyl-1,4-benzoquinol methylase